MIKISAVEKEAAEKFLDFKTDENMKAMAAFDREEMLAFCVFSLREKEIYIYKVFGEESLLDGVARAAFHYALEREILTAAFADEVINLFLSLSYIENRAQKEISIMGVFSSGCPGCKKQTV